MPGRSAIRQKSMVAPSAASTGMTRSWSPTDAPPIVTSRSAAACARIAAASASAVSAHDAAVDDVGMAPEQRGEHHAVRADDRVGAGDRAGRHQLVAGREQDDARAAVDGEGGVARRRGDADPRRGDALARPRDDRPGGEVEPGGADVRALRAAGRRRSGSACRRPRLASSWTTTVSAPAGSGAPVRMRTASPAPTVPAKRRPAALSPTIRHGPGRSAQRTA